MVAVHRELWLLGTQTTEIWFSTGDANAPFQRIQGALMDIGCAAAYSARPYNDTLAWLAHDPAGGLFVAVARGYQAQRVSTHAVEMALGEEGQVQDAVAFPSSTEGHRFYLLSVPESHTTWCFDVASGLWHERQSLEADGTMTRHRCHVGTAGFGKMLGGDCATGDLYQLSLNAYDDVGTPLVRERVSPWVTTRQVKVSHWGLYLDIDVGHGLPSDTLPAREPQVQMTFSDDGRTWSTPEMWSGAGRQGEYRTEAAWYRLGQAQRRLYKIRITDAIPVTIMGATLDLEEGQH
jgi:hypothetical protein